MVWLRVPYGCRLYEQQCYRLNFTTKLGVYFNFANMRLNRNEVVISYWSLKTEEYFIPLELELIAYARAGQAEELVYGITRSNEKSLVKRAVAWECELKVGIFHALQGGCLPLLKITLHVSVYFNQLIYSLSQSPELMRFMRHAGVGAGWV